MTARALSSADMRRIAVLAVVALALHSVAPPVKAPPMPPARVEPPTMPNIAPEQHLPHTPPAIEPAPTPPVARPRFHVALPPIKYDKPYAGTLTIVRARSTSELIGSCNASFVPGYALACAFPSPDLRRCLIYMIEDAAIVAEGHDPKEVLRHEIGHCNGWGADHAGWR